MFKKVTEVYLDVLKEKDSLPLDTYFSDPDTYMTPFSLEEITSLESTLKQYGIDPYILHEQDAFFSVELSARMDVKHVSGEVLATWHAMIRFSDFGRLFTLIGNNGVFPNPETIDYLEERGFIYIPREVLELPYEGHNQEVMNRCSPGREHTWFNRYFDYD
ncbi:MAG: hypothetical protein AAF267_10620 [Deinococcota bacterium]